MFFQKMPSMAMVQKGPAIVMTDDSMTEKGALKTMWPMSSPENNVAYVISAAAKGGGPGYGKGRTESTTMTEQFSST